MLAPQLYTELLGTAAILMGILLINNIFLYKQKISEPISLMLISGIVMCAFEIAWSQFDGNPDLKAVIYIAVGGYCVSFLIFADFLSLYLFDRLGIRPGNRR